MFERKIGNSGFIESAPAFRDHWSCCSFIGRNSIKIDATQIKWCGSDANISMCFLTAVRAVSSFFTCAAACFVRRFPWVVRLRAFFLAIVTSFLCATEPLWASEASHLALRISKDVAECQHSRCNCTEENDWCLMRTPWQLKRQHGCASADSEASHAIAGMFVAIFESQFGDAPAGFALRTRASFEDRHPAKTKATLRPKTIRDVRLRVG